MIDLGDIYQVAVDIRDASGTLTNPATATLTITKPDGTTTSPTVSLPPVETGKLRVDYLTADVGWYNFSLVTTNPNTAYSDTFDVRAADPGFIVSLADTKAHLNITTATNDEELRSFIQAATDVIESYVGSVVRRTYTSEPYDGGSTSVLLRHSPVISITSVTESGTTLDTSNWSVDTDAGILTKVFSYSPTFFTGGVGNVQVTYVVGRTVIPPNITLAARIIIQHLWETQRSQDVRRPPTALAGEFVNAADEFGRTFSIPRKAVELLEPHRQIAFA